MAATNRTTGRAHGGRNRVRVLAVLAAAVVLAAAPTGVNAGGGDHGGCTQPFASASGVTVTIEEVCFAPTVLAIAPGDEVTWTNDDPVAHTVTAAQQSWGINDALQPGDSVAYTFDEAGVYPYYCSFHMGQLGVVVVEEPGVGAASAAIESESGGGGRSLAATLILSGALLGAGGIVYRVRRTGGAESEA